ncbi:MAG: glycosyltransferase [Candidatus Omnitrophota bacterium]
MALPAISIIIPTLNSERTLRECLNSIREQAYPQGELEIIIIDGGSLDSTLEIAQSLGATVIKEPGRKDNPEARKAIGLSKASNKFVAFIDSDNILPHKDWLKAMVEPLVNNDRIVGSQPLRYQYDKKMTLLNRYFALFGVNDPIAYYFNKRDRLSWAEDGWRMMGEARDRGGYYSVRFTKDMLPTLGANGFLARKDILLKAKVAPDEFFHIDVNYDLVSQGYDEYAIIKDTIIHLSADNFFSFLKKRMEFMRRYHQRDYGLRRYRLYEPKDKYKLIVFILFSLTFVKPLYDSVRGFIKIPDIAWFLHPIMCFSIVAVYGWAIIKGLIIR